MKFVSLRDLKIRASQVVDGLGRADVVVTRRGKPVAALVRLDEDLLDDFVLAHHPTLLRGLESARREYLRKGGIGHDAMKARLLRRRGIARGLSR